jgi:hypothetical protein
MSVEQSSCFRTTNNLYNTCPPIMADGRNFTDYTPRNVSNFQFNNGSMDSYEYRQYLIINGPQIMNNTRRNIYGNNVCGPCVSPYNNATMLPERSSFVCDKTKCTNNIVDEEGLGTGRNYGFVDDAAKTKLNSFIEMKTNETFEESDCTSARTNLNHFGIDGLGDVYTNSRNAIPSGGKIISEDIN